MKLFTALLGTETNTFSPFLTGLHNFEQTLLVRHGQHPDPPPAFSLPLVIWRERARERDWQVVESLAAFATPAGTTLRPVYEALRDEILADLRAALPVDLVLLNMHGAMVAEGYDDAEGDLLARVREIVGPEVPIGGELDLHCHLTQQMVDAATVLVTFKEYPHIDIAERAEEVFQLTADAAEGKTQPHIALRDCGLLGVYHTSREPMRSFVDGMSALEQQEGVLTGVLSVSLAHGFPWGDVAELGTRVLVVTDNQHALGDEIAASLCAKLDDIFDDAQPPYRTLDESIGEALAFNGQPVVLADVADNSGGGAPNDSTFVLRRLLERGVGNAAVGCIWDPGVVELAQEIGEGVTTNLRIGGKLGPMSGDPVDLRVRIGQIARDATQRFGDGTQPLGDAVALHAENGVDIVVNTKRTQTFSPHVFTNVGIDPAQKKILVVKSMQHFYAAFAPIAAKIIYVAAPGALVPDFSLLDYQQANRSLRGIDHINRR